jgi:hypothetical protein
MEKTMNVEITNDISTRLLAQENLLINRAPVNTASFDVRNRILTLPMWQNMTAEIEEMLKAHEVGHALYTDETLFAKMATDVKVPFGYMNVLEDARIEKLMKRKYPGLRKTFNAGYRELNERDFFSVSQRDTSTLPLIDRINLWFKVGMASGVRFSVAERYIVEKAEKLETIADVMSLAKTVYDFTKKEAERKRQERENDTEYKKLKAEEEKDREEDLLEIEEDDTQFDDNDWASDTQFEDPEETDEVPEEEQEEIKVKGTNDGDTTAESEPPEEEIPQDSETQSAFARKLTESADTSTEYLYLNLPDTSKQKHVLIPYKTVVSETTAVLANKKMTKHGDVDTYLDRVVQDYEQFRGETSRVVNYLIKEFEMKKAASDYKRQSVAKTGVLDVRKLASYKIREDLFKQITITKDGQKHGMIFTIDWSGSMHDYLTETVKQLISLVTFCYRLRIPFEVYAFSDSSVLDKEQFVEQLTSGFQPNTLAIDSRYHMIQFFSNKMTLGEFNTMCRNLYVMSTTYDYRTHRTENDEPNLIGDKYQLNGTPLNEAMIWLYNYVGEFKVANQVEKLTVIKLTDGDAGGMNRYYDDKEPRAQYISNTDYRTDPVTGVSKRVKRVVLISDKYTKKSYSYEPYGCTNLVCKMIQERHNAAVVGYHVVGRGRRELMYTVSRYGVARNSIEENDMAIKIRKGFNEEMFYPVTMTGHTEMFLMPNTMKVDNTELAEDMSKLTSNQIAKKFGKYLGAKKTSRVLLNRFVAAVA